MYYLNLRTLQCVVLLKKIWFKNFKIKLPHNTPDILKRTNIIHLPTVHRCLCFFPNISFVTSYVLGLLLNDSLLNFIRGLQYRSTHVNFISGLQFRGAHVTIQNYCDQVYICIWCIKLIIISVMAAKLKREGSSVSTRVNWWRLQKSSWVQSFRTVIFMKCW